MPSLPFAAALRRLRPADDDATLLARYTAGRDPAAFEALVRRHGPTVLGVCRRILAREADAEDAFQATFLVLARKAKAVRRPAAVGNWLYGVAVNVARRARDADRRRQRAEAGWRPVVAPDQPADGLVDEELSRLPERYRLPIVCCRLEGKTMREAADALGWPPGTVATRLNRGRALLARRLARRGVVVPPVLMAAVVSEALVARTVAAGPVPAAVLSLSTEVTRAMLFTKLKAGAAVLMLTGVGTGAILARPPQPTPSPPPVAFEKVEPSPARKLLDRLKAEKADGIMNNAKWAATLRDLIRLGPSAVPDLSAELDATDDPIMLRCLGFAARAIGDKRAVTALIRAYPKTCLPADNDYGLGCNDPELLTFLQKHAVFQVSDTGYAFGRPINEFNSALRKLTGSSHGELELSFVFLAGTAAQQDAQRLLYRRCAERWAAWWEANGHGPVGLAPVLPSSALPVGFPRGRGVREDGGFSGLAEPVVAGGKQAFFDLDTGRQAGLPAHLNPDQPDAIAAWAAAEGFDLMGSEVTTGGKPVYVLRGLGLTAWPLDPARRGQVLTDLQGDKPPAVGSPAGDLLAPFDAASGRHRPEETGLFLFRTREGGYGWLFVGAEVRELLTPSDKPRAAAINPALDPVGVRKGRRFSYALLTDEAKP